MWGVLATLDGLSIHQMLRRNFIERLVLAVKILLVLGAVAWIGYAGRTFVLGSRQTHTNVAEFNTKVETSLRLANERIADSMHRPDPALAGAKNMFGSAATPNPSIQPTPKPVTNLPMTLIGTFIYKGQAPYAIIEEQKKKTQDVFNIGDMVFGDAKLKAIFADYVEIERNGKVEVLSLDSTPDRSEEMKGGVAATGTDSFVVDSSELDKALENLPLLLTQARAVPFFKEGRAVGLRLFAIKSGSLFEKIGLQNGDVLKAVNGNSLADLTQAMQLFQKLKEERSLTLTMERNMVEKELRYEIR